MRRGRRAVEVKKAGPAIVVLSSLFPSAVRLADRSGVDLSTAFERKLGIAGERYPAAEFRGSNAKYTEL